MGFGSTPGQVSVQSATQIRDALQTLTGANRLDASAIKNIGVVTPPSADPLFADVVLLLPLTTASGLTDFKGKAVTNAGSTLSTAVNNPFGSNTGVRAFAGNGAAISVAQSADFAFGDRAFAIELWLYPTSIPPGTLWGLMDTRSALGQSSWDITASSTATIFAQSLETAAGDVIQVGANLILNQWNYLCLSRSITGNHKTWINGTLAYTGAARNTNIIASGNLLVGDIINTASPYSGSFTGYASNVRIAHAYRDGSIVPTAPFPTS